MDVDDGTKASRQYESWRLTTKRNCAQSWTPILSSFFAETSGAFIEYRGSFVRNSRRPQRLDTIPCRCYLARSSMVLEEERWRVRTLFYSLLTRNTGVSPVCLRFRSLTVRVKRRQLPFVPSLFFSLPVMPGPGRFITRNCYGLRSVPLATQVQYHFHNDASHPSPPFLRRPSNVSLFFSRFGTRED